MEAQVAYNMTALEGYFNDMNMEQFIEFLEVNSISYATKPRFPQDSPAYLQVTPNDIRFKARNFNRYHEQMLP